MLAAPQRLHLFEVPEDIGGVEGLQVVLVDAGGDGEVQHLVPVADRDSPGHSLQVDVRLFERAFDEDDTEARTTEVGEEVGAAREPLQDLDKGVDATVGEVVKAFVALKAGFEPTEALRMELLGHARKCLGAAVAPKEIAFQAALPHTRSGKVMRRLLKARELGLPEGDTSTLEGRE